MQTYAPVVNVEKAAVLPTRFAALNSLFSMVTFEGGVMERTAIPLVSGLDALTIFSTDSDDSFLICRINDNTFTILRTKRK
ncbi:hypothetical protein BH10PLA1_BH10PLA1_09580 [soil metagenome]